MASTVDTVMEQYAERLRRINRSPSTQRTFKGVTKSLQTWLRSNSILELTPWLLEEYLDTKTAPATKRLHLTLIRAAFRYATKRGMELEDPTTGLESPTIADKIPKIIPIEDLKRMKEDLLYTQDALLFCLLAYSGLRINEIRQLEWDHIDLAQGMLTVVGKGGKLRSVPLHPALSEVLVEVEESRRNGYVITPRGREGTMMSPVGLWRRVHALTKGQHNAHDFRRTVATSLYINGVPAQVIDRIMGWASHSIGEKRYLHVAPTNLQSAILHLYQDHPL